MHWTVTKKLELHGNSSNVSKLVNKYAEITEWELGYAGVAACEAVKGIGDSSLTIALFQALSVGIDFDDDIEIPDEAKPYTLGSDASALDRLAYAYGLLSCVNMHNEIDIWEENAEGGVRALVETL